MLTAQAWDEVGEGLGLSKRQIQIIQAVFDDQTERAIGEALGISAHTVHTHLERLYHKLEIRDRAQLVLRVFDQFMARTTVAGSRLPPICEHYRAGCCPIAPADPPRSEDAG